MLKYQLPDFLLRGDAVPQKMSNTEILCYVIGWQGGTVHQLAEALHVSSSDIINAGYERMGELCRLAQVARSPGVSQGGESNS